MKKRKRWLLLALLPLALLTRAVSGALKAARESGEKVFTWRTARGDTPYRREKHRVRVGEGISLTATVFTPEGEGPFPAMVMVHSWGFWRIQCDLLYAPLFASRGYVVLTYDCRGWGSSGGQVSCAAPDCEMKDLEEMIDWLISESGAPVDPERIGITGISYGGGHSFLAATREPRIKAAAPMNGWTDLYSALMPNGCWKAPWSLLLFSFSLWAIKFNRGNVLVRWLKTVLKNQELEGVRGELEERSAIHRVDDVRCPMFIVHSWNDDIFEPNQILDFFDRLKVPKKLMMTNGLHGTDPGRGDILVPNIIWDEAIRFFDHWLKGERDNGVMEEPVVSYHRPWDGTMAPADGWPPAGVKDRQYFLGAEGNAPVPRGALLGQPPADGGGPDQIVNNTVVSGHWSGFPVLRLNAIGNLPIPGVPFCIRGDSACFTGEPLVEGAAIVGAPSVEVYVSSSTGECQLNALLYDVSPRGFCRLVTHCAAFRDDLEPGRVDRLDFDLIACAHRFPAGHRIRLVLCACDPMYVFPSRVPSTYHLFHDKDHPSSMKLPVIEEGGQP